jgi:hypothetical protein
MQTQRYIKRIAAVFLHGHMEEVGFSFNVSLSYSLPSILFTLSSTTDLLEG